MRPINSEFYVALVETDATKEKAREVAKSVTQCDTVTTNMKSKLLRPWRPVLIDSIRSH
jgi:hypothetical protein